MTRQSNPCKNSVCKRNIKDNDKSAISCEKCELWFHGPCVSLSVDDVDWLGARKNCKWICDTCDSDQLFPSEAKLTKTLDENKIADKVAVALSAKIGTEIPKIIELALPNHIKDNFEKVFNETLPSFRDAVLTNKKIKGHKTANEPMQFLINGLPENANSYNKLIESDTKLLDEVITFMGLKSDGNIVQARRLGKFKNPANNERRLYRPILITTNSPHFMENCFARSHYLKDFRIPVYIKKFLTQSDRELEKKILSKRFQMIGEGKSKKDFRIRNLQLFYQGNLVNLNESVN